MDRPMCETCVYYSEKTYTQAGPNLTCNRYPQGAEKDRNDWCGEHPDFRAWMAKMPSPTLSTIERLVRERDSRVNKSPDGGLRVFIDELLNVLDSPGTAQDHEDGGGRET